MASYPPPTPIEPLPIFNPSDFPANSDAVANDISKLDFPVAQGLETFVGIINNGETSLSANVIMTGVDGVNYIQFPNGSKQYVAGGGGSFTNPQPTLQITSTQVAPCPTAGLTNMFNTGGYASQYFSNVAYSYINIWVDFQTFISPSTYQDSMMVQVDLVWDGNDASPSANYGNCSFLCKLFPKRIYSSAQWGTHYAGVSATTNNSYTGLASYNSTNASYAPYGRQYWCSNIQGSSACNVYGGASYCLFQFPKPIGSNYSCSTSIRVLDSSVAQTNTQVPSANSGVKVYINYEV
jgi:hypothetical protein